MISNLQSVVSALATLESCGVSLVRRDELDVHLGDHTELPALLEPICKALRDEFGETAELVLELYKDPGDPYRYPVIYVRQERYEQGIFDRIETVTDRFRDQIRQPAATCSLP